MISFFNVFVPQTTCGIITKQCVYTQKIEHLTNLCDKCKDVISKTNILGYQYSNSGVFKGYIIMLIFSVLAKGLYDETLILLKRRTTDIEGPTNAIEMAADAGYIPAKIKMAWCRLMGEGTYVDPDYAHRVFSELADQGVADAHAVSGFCSSTSMMKVILGVSCRRL